METWGYHRGYSERKRYGVASKKGGGGIVSIRNENDSLREIRTLPNHVADREPRGGGEMSHSVWRRDEMEMSGQGTREASLQ